MPIRARAHLLFIISMISNNHWCWTTYLVSCELWITEIWIRIPSGSYLWSLKNLISSQNHTTKMAFDLSLPLTLRYTQLSAKGGVSTDGSDDDLFLKYAVISTIAFTVIVFLFESYLSLRQRSTYHKTNFPSGKSMFYYEFVCSV